MPPEPLRIFWRHVGREHVVDGYAEDIRLNSPETIDAYLAAKEARPSSNWCLQIDAATFVEAPDEPSSPPWVIVYFADLGLQLSYGYKQTAWWLVDVVRISERASGAICVADLFIDIDVMPDLSYRIRDYDEFHLAAQLGVIDPQEVTDALASLQSVLNMLTTRFFPGKRVIAAIKQAGLPVPGGE